MANPVLREALARRIKRNLKKVRFLFGSRGLAQPVFVMGYGRSGTTMLLDAFEHDMRVEVLGENDPRIARDHLLVRELVGPVVRASRAQAIVMKPILDSFDVSDLMRSHPTSRVIWMLRSFEPVVASAIKKFGTSVADELREAVVHDQGSGWIKRGLPLVTLNRLRRLDVNVLEANDWMALVWWSVNVTLLSPELFGNNRVLIVRYEDLTQDPEAWMRNVYQFVGLPFRSKSVQWIGSAAGNSVVGIDVRHEVRTMCEDLSRDLHSAFFAGKVIAI